jgi:hypothetical protein
VQSWFTARDIISVNYYRSVLVIFITIENSSTFEPEEEKRLDYKESVSN